MECEDKFLKLFMIFFQGWFYLLIDAMEFTFCHFCSQILIKNIFLDNKPSNQ